MNVRSLSFTICVAVVSAFSIAQTGTVSCPPTSTCTSPAIPVFTSSTGTPQATNSSLSQKPNGSITDSAGFSMAGPQPWIDVTAQGLGAVANCDVTNLASCTDQSSRINQAISNCASASNVGRG